MRGATQPSRTMIYHRFCTRRFGHMEAGQPIEPFPQPKRERAQAAPPVEEELCDFEIERQKNIARNQELLRQLGLA